VSDTRSAGGEALEERRSGRWTPVREEAATLSSALPPLLVEAERIAATVAQGVHGRRRVGPGETFWQFRRYSAGDASSDIDWRRSARSQHLFVRENEWEAAQSVWLWRDGSASMDFASVGLQTKLHRAGVLALALAMLLVQAGERIAALGEPHPPQTGRAPLDRLAYLYGRPAPAAAALPAPQPMPRHAHTVWLSDFLFDADLLLERMRMLAGAGVTGHLLQILDPSEADYAFQGRVRFEAVEDETKLLVGRAESLKSEYDRRLSNHQARIGAEARRLGWTFSVHRSDNAPHTALLALYAAVAAERQN
jgi:uncharacterized protein (DUF58 family)